MQLRYIDKTEAGVEEVIGLAFLNPLAAAKLLAKFEQAYVHLASFPRSGHRVSAFPDSGCWEFIVGPYHFFYFIDDPRNTVWIIDFWHEAQLPTYRWPKVGAGRRSGYGSLR